MKYLEEEQEAKMLAYGNRKRGYKAPKRLRPRCDYICEDGHRCNARAVMNYKKQVLTGQCVRHSPLAALVAEVETN